MADKKRVGVFFDGTGNHNENDKGIDKSNSNVGRLYDQYSGDDRFYEKGVGTADLTKKQIKKVHDAKGEDSFTMPWEEGDNRSDYYSETAQAVGHGMDTRVDNNLEKIKDFISDNPDSELTIDIFGFSRGAAEARFFINKANAYINEKNLQGKVKVGFVGIYDTVESDNVYNGRQGNINLNKDSADKIVHFTAKDERRDTFDLTTLKDKDGKLASNMEEIEMIGVHSDVGGGYNFTKKGEGEDCDADEEQCYRAEPAVRKCLTAPYLGGDNAILQRSLELDSFAKKHNYNILEKTRTFYMNPQTPVLSNTEVCAKMEHRVYDGLNNVHLNLMIDKARDAGVPLNWIDINNEDYSYNIKDEELKKYYQLKKENKPISQNLSEEIQSKYVNDSTIGLMNFDNDSGIFDADGKARDTILNKPNEAVPPNKVKEEKDYGQDNHVTLPSQNKYDYVTLPSQNKYDYVPFNFNKSNNDFLRSTRYKLKTNSPKQISPGQKRMNWVMDNVFNPLAKSMSLTTQKYVNETVNFTQSMAKGSYDRGLKGFYDNVNEGSYGKAFMNAAVGIPNVVLGAAEGLTNYVTDNKYEDKVKSIGDFVDIGMKGKGIASPIINPTKKSGVYNMLDSTIGAGNTFLSQTQAPHKSNTINVNLENKSQKLFKKLGLKHEKIPTLNHDQNLPDNVEGMYRKDDLTLKKNPRVSDKKAEAVAMHEIYHHTQKDKGLELWQEEAQANMIEKAYLNEIEEDSQEIEFDLIYAYTIKQFYEHEELEQLVCILDGDVSSAKKVYSNAMYVIAESKGKEINNIGYDNSQVKKVIGDSGFRYKESDRKYSLNEKGMQRNEFGIFTQTKEQINKDLEIESNDSKIGFSSDAKYNIFNKINSSGNDQFKVDGEGGLIFGATVKEDGNYYEGKIGMELSSGLSVEGRHSFIDGGAEIGAKATFSKGVGWSKDVKVAKLGEGVGGGFSVDTPIGSASVDARVEPWQVYKVVPSANPYKSIEEYEKANQKSVKTLKNISSKAMSRTQNMVCKSKTSGFLMKLLYGCD